MVAHCQSLFVTWEPTSARASARAESAWPQPLSGKPSSHARASATSSVQCDRSNSAALTAARTVSRQYSEVGKAMQQRDMMHCATLRPPVDRGSKPTQNQAGRCGQQQLQKVQEIQHPRQIWRCLNLNGVAVAKNTAANWQRPNVPPSPSIALSSGSMKTCAICRSERRSVSLRHPFNCPQSLILDILWCQVPLRQSVISGSTASQGALRHKGEVKWLPSPRDREPSCSPLRRSPRCTGPRA